MNSYKELARLFDDLSRRVSDLETSPSLPWSSVDQGSVEVRDADGQAVLVLGRQVDGSWQPKPVDGVQPPDPTGVTVQGGTALTVTWDGTAATPLPNDFESLRIYATVGDKTDYLGSITAPTGGSKTVEVPSGRYEIYVAIRNLAGMESDDVPVGGVSVSTAATQEALEMARENISAVDSSAKAAQAAADAAQAAAALNQLAIEAAQEAQDLENARLEGLAVDADAKADEARARADELAEQAQAAMTAAQQAQTSADGKALVAYSDYQPATVSGQKIIWFKPGSVPKLFDGTTWRSVQPGDGVVEALDIGKATVGELSGMRIKAGSASVDILIPGENARWTSSGLTIYHPLTPEQKQAGIKPTEWDKRATALNLTSDGARFISVADEAGTVTAYMSPQGEVSGRELTITGAAAVDTLTVGGLDLVDVIETNSLIAAYTVTPNLIHTAGFGSVGLVDTDWVQLEAGRYFVSWPVHARIFRSGSASVAASARIVMIYRKIGDTKETTYTWPGGNDRLTAFASTSGADQYFFTCPQGMFTAQDGYEYRFELGSQVTQSWKMDLLSSVFTVKRLPESLALGAEIRTQPTPIKPPAPKIVTASAALSGVYYAYGSTFAQSGSYASGGNFNIPGAKGKTIKSIRLTGKCNFDFIDGGAGLDFPFSLGGEKRTAFVRDYGTVDISFSASGGAATALRNLGRVAFQAMSGAPAYNEYNAGSFRCTVTYQ